MVASVGAVPLGICAISGRGVDVCVLSLIMRLAAVAVVVVSFLEVKRLSVTEVNEMASKARSRSASPGKEVN
jgi:hypothetical protein